MAVGGTMQAGGTYNTLDTVLGSLDIPCMAHDTYDRISKEFGKEGLQLAVDVFEQNAKKEAELTFQKGGSKDSKERIGITVSYDGNQNESLEVAFNCVYLIVYSQIGFPSEDQTVLKPTLI
jgi:hypothetical protein